MAGYPEANRRHYAFMLQGLAEVERTLRRAASASSSARASPPRSRSRSRGTPPWWSAIAAICATRRPGASASPRRRHAGSSRSRATSWCPVEIASDQHEIAARTLRPKLHRVWDDYLRPLDETPPEHDAGKLALRSEVDLSDLDRVLDGLKLDAGVLPVRRFEGGTSARAQAPRELPRRAASTAMPRAAASPAPSSARCSARICTSARSRRSRSRSQVRDGRGPAARRPRRLSRGADRAARAVDEFRRLQPGLRPLRLPARLGAGAPCAIIGTIPREHRYSVRQLERAETHDIHWNTAMREMVHTGFMHNYMRMYWAKKILEWSQDAGARLPRPRLQLNNKLFPRRPRRQLLRQRRLGLRPARPALARAAGVRQGALHDRGRPRAQVRHEVLPLRGRPAGARAGGHGPAEVARRRRSAPQLRSSTRRGSVVARWSVASLVASASRPHTRACMASPAADAPSASAISSAAASSSSASSAAPATLSLPISISTGTASGDTRSSRRWTILPWTLTSRSARRRTSIRPTAASARVARSSTWSGSCLRSTS